MAVPTVEGVALQTPSNASTSCTVTIPTTAANDIVIHGVTCRDTTTGITFAGDFTPTRNNVITVSSSNPITQVSWYRCTGNHSGQTIQTSNVNAGSICASVMVVRGCLTSASPVDTNTNTRRDNASPDVNTLSTFDTTVNDALVVLCVGAQDNIAWSAQTKNSVSMTEQTEATSSGGNDSMQGFATLGQASSGATGGFDFTQDLGTTDAKWIIGFALKPVPSTTYNDSPSGTISLSGSATDSWYISTVYNDSPTGTVSLAGTKTESHVESPTPTGTTSLSGTRTESLVHSQSVAGTVGLSGTATEEKGYVDTAEGIVSLSGSVVESWEVEGAGPTYNDSPTGRIRFFG